MATDTVEITLLGAPLAKARVRFSKATGHAFTPERTVNYESRLAHEAQAVMGDRPLMDGPLSVEVLIRMQIPESKPRKWKEQALAGLIYPTKKPDADNYAKILDALNLIVWTDDSQIVSLHVDKIYSDRPAFIARISPKQSNGVFG
jgi:Holliday junction resolvase RusA-like endonuclease